MRPGEPLSPPAFCCIAACIPLSLDRQLVSHCTFYVLCCDTFLWLNLGKKQRQGAHALICPLVSSREISVTEQVVNCRRLRSRVNANSIHSAKFGKPVHCSAVVSLQPLHYRELPVVFSFNSRPPSYSSWIQSMKFD